jgi:NAD(P)H-dependent FMN reductase
MVHLLLVSGSLRAGSTNTAVLRTVERLVSPSVEAALYEGLASLPAFNPDHESDPPLSVRELRQTLHRAHALVFSVPEYAGALPGSFKNLLDWTIGDADAGSIYDKPVAWINASPRGAAGAHAELKTVLEYAHAHIVAGASANVPVTSAMVDEEGLVNDTEVADHLRTVIERLVATVRRGPYR